MRQRWLWILLAASSCVMGSGNAPAGEPGNGEQSTHFVRIPAGAMLAAADLGMAPNLHLDYGSCAWLELVEADFQVLQASGVAFNEEHEPFAISLGEEHFDLCEVQESAGGRPVRLELDGPDLHLLQFVGPTRDEWIEAVAGNGLDIVQYIHPYTYVVWGRSGALSAAAESSAVRCTGDFSPAYRLLPRYRNLPSEEIHAKVLLYRGADPRRVERLIGALGAKVDDREVLNQTFEIMGFSAPGAMLSQIAEISGVYSVQPVKTDGGLRGEMSDQVCADNVDGGNMAYPGYLPWLGSIGFDGSGVIIANVDGGISDTHVDLVNRMVPCSGDTCGGGASSSHGTHTAGIMAADGSAGVLDSYGFLRGLGVAPGANLVEQVYSPWYSQPGGMLKLIRESRANGASLSGNSWGPAGTPRGYDDDTMQCDIGVRDADPNTPGNQQFSFVLSIMNGYGGTSSQGTPDEAKNIFTIGSTKMQTSGGAQYLDFNNLSANTAHGPALDGRKIPHMVAP
ncbi:MAG: S8 family serine peptidase, partial [Acidobacteriota bacterium]